MTQVGMYSSKFPHSHHGVAYLGGKYVDAHRREGQADRYKSKQFSVAHPKSGHCANEGVLFSRLKAADKKEPYDVGNKYLDLHPLDQRKSGFGTRDAPKKGEFLSVARADQHKQAMKSFEKSEKEQVYKNGPIEEQIERLKSKIAAIDAKHSGLNCSVRPVGDFAGSVPKRGYDIGHTQHGTTPIMFHNARDQFYSQKRCNDLGKKLYVQRGALSSGEYGLRQWGTMKGDRTITMEGPKGGSSGTFLDKTHLHVTGYDD